MENSPRLRLPLPYSNKLKNFISNYQGIKDKYYQYVYAPYPFNMSFEVTYPITNIILLNRQSCSTPHITYLSQDICLSEILRHYVMLEGTAKIIFQQSLKIIENFSILSFQYSELDSAAVFFQKFFFER